MPAPHPHPSRRWTVEEVRALMDETSHTPRYELIDGELLVSFADAAPAVTNAPTPQHQRAVRELLVALDGYARAADVGEALAAPAALELEPGTVVQPDVFVAPLAAGRGVWSWRDVRTLLLAVEVLSPSTARHDRLTKRRFYQRVGVPEYWIVDLDARVVERWRPADERPELLDERLVWHVPGTAAPLALDLATLFSRVLDG